MTEQHHIYHWKHGWIPLTHAAAMSKAKGNSKLADKFVPGASHHHDARIATHGMSAAQIHAKLAPHKHHSDPAAVAKLRDGDHALVHGMDEHGQPTSFAGTVHGTPTPVRLKRGRNGAVEHHLAVSMHNGSDRSGGDASARTTVYVKNPGAASTSRGNLPEIGSTVSVHAASGRTTMIGKVTGHSGSDHATVETVRSTADRRARVVHRDQMKPYSPVAATSRAVNLPGSPAHVSAVRTSQGRVKITDTIHGASFETNEGRLASALNQGHKVNGVTAGRLQTIGDDGAHHSFGPGMDDGRIEVRADDGLTIMQRAQRAESAKNPMNRMTNGTNWRETPRGLIAVRGDREVHLLGTSVNAQKKARQMLADHSFDHLFKSGTKAPSTRNVAFHKLEGESLHDRLDRHKVESEAARANLTPGGAVKVAEGTHWHNIGMTGGELVKVGRTKAHVRHSNGVVYQVPIRHVSPATPTAEGHHAGTAKPSFTDAFAPDKPGEREARDARITASVQASQREHHAAAQARATRGSAGERITSHGPGFDHRAAQKKQATEAGQTSRAKINDEIKREWGDREVVGSIKDDASVPEVTRLIRNTPGMKLAGLDRVDVEKVDGAIPGFMVEIPSQNRKLFVPTRRGVDTALRRANSRPAGDSVIHHDGVAYTHSPGMGGIVHNQMGGHQVGMINPHPDGNGFLVHTTSGFGAPKPGEPGYLPEHRVDTMKQAIAGLHVADRMQQNHRAAESGKRAAEAAALKDSMAGRFAQENERKALMDKITAASPHDKPSFPAAAFTGTHEEQMAALRKVRSEQIVAAQAERARQDIARKSHFRVAPAKPSRTTRDTATMQASRDKLTAALDRAPLDVRAVGEDGFAALREGSAISVGGHVGHVIQKQGNDVLSYHPPTAQHRQGRYYRHTRRKGRNGLTETGAWESNARA